MTWAGGATQSVQNFINQFDRFHLTGEPATEWPITRSTKAGSCIIWPYTQPVVETEG